MTTARPIRVLHCPHNVRGNPQGLAAAEREVGLASHCVAYREHPGFPADEVLLSPADRWWVRERKRLSLLRRALRDYDVVHFNMGQTMFPPLPAPGAAEPEAHPVARALHRRYASLLNMSDLPLLRRANKAIVATFVGDDVRRGWSWGKPGSPFEVDLVAEGGFYVPGWDEGRERVAARFAQFSDRLFYASPDLALDLPEWAEFLPIGSVDLQSWRPVRASTDALTPLRVVHAPSVSWAKGTRYIVAAVDALRADGVDLDFRLIEGLSYAEARRAYERADVVIDQVLVGWYGGLSIEAMALGKPVVCYIRDSTLRYVPQGLVDDLPIIRASRESIGDALRHVASLPRERLAEIGAASRRYVERWHDPRRIALLLRDHYEEILAAQRR